MPIEIPYELDSPAVPPPPPPITLPLAPMGAEAYARQLQQLLPRGAWFLDEGSVLRRMLLAIASELARIDSRAYDLLREQDPRTAIETIEAWERVLGLDAGALTLSERQLAVAQRIISRGGQSRAFFIEMAEAFGYECVTIEEFRFSQLRVGFSAGDRCTGNRWAHTWRINLPGGPGPRADVEAAIRQASPAQTRVLFSYA